MNEEQVKGAEEKSGGKIEEVAGHITGNKNLENKGKVNQVKGAIHNAVGDAKDNAEDAFTSAKTPPTTH